MKKSLFLILCILCLTVSAFAQEAIAPDGSNTNSISYGNSYNQYDYLLNPAFIGMLEGNTLFFALDNSGTQFGAAPTIGIEGFRAGWAVNDGLGLMMDYRTWTNTDIAEVGGEDTPDNAEDDYQNIELDYTGYDQATGRYATITEDVNQNLKNTTHDHELLFHSAFGLGDGMGAAAQLLFAIHSHDTHSLDYTNTYSDTSAPTAATLTSKGDLTETVNTLLDNSENDIALDLEFGMNTDSFLTRIVLGTDINNLRFSSNSYTETTTVYNDGAGVDDTIRDEETVLSYTGQYYENGGPDSAIDMNTGDPSYLSTLGLGISADTEIAMDNDITVVIPFDVGYDFPLGTLNSVFTTTTIAYNDADANNAETGRTVTTITSTLDKGIDLYTQLGGGIKKVFKPSGNTAVTVTPLLIGSFGIEKDTRSRTETYAVQSDNNGDGDYADAGTDTDTVYSESGYEIQRTNIDSIISLNLPVSAEWKANDLMTFRAGYFMSMRYTIASTSSLITGGGGYIYEQYTDNLTEANTYAVRQKDGVSSESTPDSNFSGDFSFVSGGSFGASLDISDNFTLDMRATGSQVEIDAFTVMGIMKY